MSINKRIFAILLLLALTMGLIACAGPVTEGAAQTEAVSPSQGGITVVGQGEAFGKPDQAHVQVGVETFAPSVSEATSQNEATLQALMAALTAEGIAEEDIQTSNYNLWAEQIYGDRGPEGISGYRVNNQVSVTIQDIDKVGDVLAAVTGAGANSIHGVFFTVADPASLEAEARAAAVADARARAQSLADLGGLTLGDIKVITEVVGQPGPGPYPMGGGGYAVDMAVSEGAPSISAGQLSYNVQIQVTFGIK